MILKDFHSPNSPSHFTRQNNILSNGVGQFRLRNWIIIGYSIPVFLALVSSVAVFFKVQTVRPASQGVVHSARVESAIGDLGFNIQTLERTTRGYLLSKSSISLASFRNSKDALDQVIIPELNGLVQDEQQKQTFARIIDAYTQLERNNTELINLVDAGKTAEAIQRWKSSGREYAEELAALLTIFKQRESQLVDENDQKLISALDSLTVVVFAATGASLLLAIAVGWLIINNISQRMNQTASILVSSTSEIAATIEQQERTASQQAASVNETTTTMDELGASSRQSSEQAEAAVSAARQALQLADGGTKAVEQSLGGMNTLKEKVGAIAEQILRLSEQTNQIGNISQLVSDLANQTNMLALNAAVEAVRAGEHGKGFSVVATEIRKLADRSKQSAQRINDLVADIQHAINSTVMVTDEGTKTVDSSVQISQETAQAFAGVAEAVNNVVLNNQQISLNIRQQAAAIQQVVQAMNNINQGAKEAANGIGQTKIGTAKLNETAQFLQEMV